MLSSAGIEVVGSRVGDVSSGIIGDDGDIITYLGLLRPTFQRVERLTDSYVGSPRNTAVGAIGIE